MERRRQPYTEIELLSDKTLTGLRGVRGALVVNGQNPSRVDRSIHPLNRAIYNLIFINESIGPVISEFKQRTGEEVEVLFPIAEKMRWNTAEVRWFRFNSEGLSLIAVMYDTALTPDILQQMWDEKSYRELVKKLGNMSKDSILKKFEKTVRKHI